jgi:hypothetical protein
MDDLEAEELSAKGGPGTVAMPKGIFGKIKGVFGGKPALEVIVETGSKKVGHKKHPKHGKHHHGKKHLEKELQEDDRSAIRTL